jgi:hypothetical protein
VLAISTADEEAVSSASEEVEAEIAVDIDISSSQTLSQVGSNHNMSLSQWEQWKTKREVTYALRMLWKIVSSFANTPLQRVLGVSSLDELRLGSAEVDPRVMISKLEVPDYLALGLYPLLLLDISQVNN